MLRLKLILSILGYVLLIDRAQAVPIEIDPGAAGSAYSYASFHFFDLSGTTFSGQTLSVDIRFTDDKFLVSSRFFIDLFLNQSGGLGTLPTTGLSITGYLVSALGDGLTTPLAFSPIGAVPAQIWPGWPYYLPDGTPYYPATTIYGAFVIGTPIDVTPYDYFVDPLIFSGLHLDITFPNNSAVSLIGGKLAVSNFEHPIYVSPGEMPKFYVHVPDAPFTLVLFSGAIIGLECLRKRPSRRGRADGRGAEPTG